MHYTSDWNAGRDEIARKHRRTWEDNSTPNLRDTGLEGADWIYLAQYRTDIGLL
jgi:hypothetical protein